jgi:hypothetical protein
VTIDADANEAADEFEYEIDYEAMALEAEREADVEAELADLEHLPGPDDLR